MSSAAGFCVEAAPGEAHRRHRDMGLARLHAGRGLVKLLVGRDWVKLLAGNAFEMAREKLL
jgi:hypothetical protein